jgi:2-phospho-L-lactate guanylyltransferase
MRVVVPFGAAEPKTRLSPVLDAGQRREFAEAMLADVLGALSDCGYEPTVLADRPTDVSSLAGEPAGCDASVVVDERPLTAAVNAQLPADADDPVAVVMADLALATPAALDRLFGSAGDVVLAPGLGGGTNAVVARHPDFRVDYHGASIRDHRVAAADAGLSLATVDSFRLATDVDEPVDLAEVLLHGEGRAAAWLRGAGFDVAEDDGRVRVDGR